MSRRVVVGLATLLLVTPLFFWSVVSVHADTGVVQVSGLSVTSEFPKGIRFKAEFTGGNEIISVVVRFRVGQVPIETYDYLKLKKEGTRTKGELLWRTNTASSYIPPGTIITYHLEIEDSGGTTLETEKREFLYHDVRFEWEEVTNGPVTVAYHGPVRTRAQTVLDVIVETISSMGPLLGADIEEPIRVSMYNNVKEMLVALPPGSSSIRRELITEGQAFSNIGTILVLGIGSNVKGTASHEVTHILVHRAGEGVYRNVPSWLNEGLAEYGNIDPGFSYDIALEFAIAADRLLPITSRRTIPGKTEEVMIFYGEARSLIKFMVEVFGEKKIAELMALLKSGKTIDDALKGVYGIDRLTLENLWRENIGAPNYDPPTHGSGAPTPISRPTLLPYTLTPTSSTSGESKTLVGERGGVCSGISRGVGRQVDVSMGVLLVGLVGLGFHRRVFR